MPHHISMPSGNGKRSQRLAKVESGSKPSPQPWHLQPRCWKAPRHVLRTPAVHVSPKRGVGSSVPVPPASQALPFPFPALTPALKHRTPIAAKGPSPTHHRVQRCWPSTPCSETRGRSPANSAAPFPNRDLTSSNPHPSGYDCRYRKEQKPDENADSCQQSASVAFTLGSGFSAGVAEHTYISKTLPSSENPYLLKNKIKWPSVWSKGY